MLLKEETKKYIWWAITGLAVLITVFMHVYKISNIPFGLNVDEASAAYDALNIARYGVDRYLNSYPVYFTNYGDGQNALYIYITAVFIKLFGVSKLTIRAGIILASFAGAYFMYRYSTYAWAKRRINVVSLMLYAVIPVFTMTQRFGLESHLMLAAGIASVFFMARALDTANIWYYLGAGIVCGLTLYTYAIAYIVLPICILLLGIYGLRLKSFTWKRAVVFAVPLGIFAAPLILVQLVNIFDLNAFRIGPFTITKLLTYRANEVGSADIWTNIKNVLFNTLLYDNRMYNSSARFGNMYYVSIPFIALGFGKSTFDTLKSFRGKFFSYSVPMTAWMIGQLVIGSVLTGQSVPNNTRMIGIFGALLYFLVTGLVFTFDVLKVLWLKYSFAGIMSLIYCIGFLCFSKFYFTDYNTETYPFHWLFFESYDDVGDFFEENNGEAFLENATTYPLNYIYYLLEFEVNPYDFNLPVNGKEMYGKHDINEYMDKADYRFNYVVYEKDTSSKELLESMGYECLMDKSYLYYASPLTKFVAEQSEGSMVSVDAVLYEETYLKISGWSVDSVNNKPYTAFVLKTDSDIYEAEIKDRKDVASFLGNEAYSNYGYEFHLSADLLNNTNAVLLYGLDENHTETLLYSWKKQ